MGREAKRVPLDFNWPLHETWEGYLLPDSLSEPTCDTCCGTGTTAAMDWLESCAHLILMLDSDLNAQEQGRPMHPYFDSLPLSGRPSPEIREIAEGLCGRGASFLGHDAIDRFQATRSIVEAAGLDPKTWGLCPECQGHGSVEQYEGQRAEAETWEPSDPPEGEGWQMWETTSEGSPISPVYSTAEALADWCESNASVFGSNRVSSTEWLAIIKGEEVAHVDIAPGVTLM